MLQYFEFIFLFKEASLNVISLYEGIVSSCTLHKIDILRVFDILASERKFNINIYQTSFSYEMFIWAK